MTLRPDFSPKMLRAFLFARQVTREGFEGRPVLARRDLVAELMTLTGLPESVLKDAFAGRLKDAGSRAAIWAALGHFPADFGIVFDDRGGSCFAHGRTAPSALACAGGAQPRPSAVGTAP